MKRRRSDLGETRVRISKISPRLTAGILIAVFFGVALFIRTYFPHGQVFGSDWIKFTSTDAYYQMRLVDNMMHHFPHRILFDPYLNFPGGTWVNISPFFHWLLGGIIWVIGLGSPTQHTVNVVGAYFPAILGALTVVPVYFIGRELFGRWAGVIAAGLLAVLGGEFLGRSISGFTDHHVAEVLFTATAMMFLVMAIRSSRERQLTFGHLWQRDWATISKPLIYSLLAGILLGIYLISWVGALLFVFIVAVYFIIQFIIDHLRRQSTDYLCVAGVVLFFVALVVCAPFWISVSGLPSLRNVSGPVSLMIALLIPVVLSVISRQMTSKGTKRAYYPLALLGLGGIGLAILYFSAPFLWETMIRGLRIFTPVGPITIMEMQPLLFPQGDFTTTLAWRMFGVSFFIVPISVVFLIYLMIKRGSADKSLLVVWSVVILAATLGQRRFAYYYAVNAALLAGYLSFLGYYVIRFIIDKLRGERTDYMSWQVLEVADFEGLTVQPVKPSTRVERKKAKRLETKKAKRLEREEARMGKRREARFHPNITYISIGLWVIVIFFLVFFPIIGQAEAVARGAIFAPSDAWCSSLTWLRENTPEPFGDPGHYYHLYEPPLPEEPYKDPESAYGVTAWGDYGYWILRIGHRPVNRGPGPGGGMIAQYFVSQDEESAEEMRQKLGTSYVIIDQSTTMTKFYAIAKWAGTDGSQFYDIYYMPQGGELIRVYLFYPEYYRSLVVRLYSFDGQAVIPQESMVISYEERVTQEGIPLKLVTDSQTFPTHEEAVAYISGQESGNYRIASGSPFVSPVPLEALKDYRLIHSSDEGVEIPDMGITVPEVKIFEYVGPQ